MPAGQVLHQRGPVRGMMKSYLVILVSLSKGYKELAYGNSKDVKELYLVTMTIQRMLKSSLAIMIILSTLKSYLVIKTIRMNVKIFLVITAIRMMLKSSLVTMVTMPCQVEGC